MALTRTDKQYTKSSTAILIILKMDIFTYLSVIILLEEV